MVAQLEALRLPLWAVFAALHLPDELPAGAKPGSASSAGASSALGARRTQLVRALLRRHAPAWAADARAAEAFLVGRLRLPHEWLADALAGWAQHRRDIPGALPASPSGCHSPQCPWNHSARKVHTGPDLEISPHVHGRLQQGFHRDAVQDSYLTSPSSQKVCLHLSSETGYD